jgi:hypothetical protein
MRNGRFWRTMKVRIIAVDAGQATGSIAFGDLEARIPDTTIGPVLSDH